MNPTVLQQLDAFARRLLPLGITLALVLLETMPLLGSIAVTPALSLLSLYYWAVYRPDLMPPVAVFCVGLLIDTVSGVVLGVNALVLLLVYGAVLSQRRWLFGKSLNAVWLGFLFAALGYGVLSWGMQSVLHKALLDASLVAVQLSITAAIFPGVSWLLRRAQRQVGRVG